MRRVAPPPARGDQLHSNAVPQVPPTPPSLARLSSPKIFCYTKSGALAKEVGGAGAEPSLSTNRLNVIFEHGCNKPSGSRGGGAECLADTGVDAVCNCPFHCFLSPIGYTVTVGEIGEGTPVGVPAVLNSAYLARITQACCTVTLSLMP